MKFGWRYMLPQIIAERAWRNGWLIELARAVERGQDPRKYIEPSWLKRNGL